MLAATVPRRHNQGLRGQLPIQATLATRDTCARHAVPGLRPKHRVAILPVPATGRLLRQLSPGQGELGDSGGLQPASAAPAEDAPQILPMLSGSIRQENTSLLQMQTASSASGRGERGSVSPCLGSGWVGLPRSPRGSPLPREEHPGRARSIGFPEIPKTTERRCPQVPSSQQHTRIQAQQEQGPTGTGDTGGGRDAAHGRQHRTPALPRSGRRFPRYKPPV